MPRYYLRKLRSEHNGYVNGERAAALYTGRSSSVAVLEPPAGVTTLTPVDIRLLDDELPATPLDVETDESPITDGEGGDGGARRRRRRGRRGRGATAGAPPATDAAAGEEFGVLPGEPALPPVPIEFDEHYVPDVPPSSHLAAMVESGGLVLPDRRRRRRRGGYDGMAGEQAAPLPARLPEPPAARAAGGPRDRMTVSDEQVLRQTVLLDQLLARQTAMLKSIERMVQVMERRGGVGGGGGSYTAAPRVAVFVDVPNIVYAAERIGIWLDWRKILSYLTRDRQLVRATAYAPVSDDPHQRIESQKFVQPFYNLPYRILTKPLKRFGNGEIKANFDVELAIDAITMADRLDIICLVSGDGDFRRMVEIVQAKGVRVEVIAFSSSTAGDLRTVCDDYIDISQHLDEFSVTR